MVDSYKRTLDSSKRTVYSLKSLLGTSKRTVVRIKRIFGTSKRMVEVWQRTLRRIKHTHCTIYRTLGNSGVFLMQKRILLEKTRILLLAVSVSFFFISS